MPAYVLQKRAHPKAFANLLLADALSDHSALTSKRKLNVTPGG
jgi:hypothetical protein